MSRGHGTRQRAILDRLQAAVDDDRWPHWVLIADGVRSASDREGIRRAARTLENEGAVEVRRGRQLEVRLPLNAKQRARERRRELRGRLDRSGWPEFLWERDEFSGWGFDFHPDDWGSLLRAGVPAEFLYAEWWDANTGENLPRYLQMKTREPKTPRRVEREERRRERAEAEGRWAEWEAERRRIQLGRGAGVVA